MKNGFPMFHPHEGYAQPMIKAGRCFSRLRDCCHPLQRTVGRKALISAGRGCAATFRLSKGTRGTPPSPLRNAICLWLVARRKIVPSRHFVIHLTGCYTTEKIEKESKYIPKSQKWRSRVPVRGPIYQKKPPTHKRYPTLQIKEMIITFREMLTTKFKRLSICHHHHK